jgi:DNA-directed RNA polymerase subunit RPC12/RpoP/regulation of enolase protein 1 (concanavalin A-like superfamily)
MSEFKYACPVCGQHIRCDSSQAGTVMECPTCFQRIIVPQAPANQDQKFILTGTKADEKRPTTLAQAVGKSPRHPGRSFPVAAGLFVLVLALAVGAGLHFFGWRLTQWLGHWQSVDVGPVGLPGSFERQGDDWTIAGSGADIWGQSDAFHFVCRPANGDVSLTTRVLGLQRSDPWAKAGLMIRDSLAPESAYAMVLVTPSSGVAFQLRSTTGGQADSVLIASTTGMPCWLRLARRLNVFSADYSADGKSWTPMGSTVIAMQPKALAGLAVTAHNYSALCPARFDHVNIQGGESGGHTASATPLALPGEAQELVAPPANDSNWVLALNGRPIPDSPAAGRIHGQDFITERASFQDNTLVLRAGKHEAELAALIDFGGAPVAQLAGKTINVATNAAKAAKVTLSWKDAAGNVQTPSYAAGYALRLEFGNLADDRLPGKIYLCLPDPQKSYLLGSFEARVAKPKTQ